jgi:hypothetical protein
MAAATVTTLEVFIVIGKIRKRGRVIEAVVCRIGEAVL